MDRRLFIKSALASVVMSAIWPKDMLGKMSQSSNTHYTALPASHRKKYCRAITMWDFSWLERNWPGAGFENWDQALDELVERGYNAVRIDAYPHLVSANPYKEWTLNEVWNQQTWGSPDKNKVHVQPNLNKFIAACKKRNVKVALSTWYREDTDGVFMKVNTPQKMAKIWLDTLHTIGQDNLLDNILYVDLCNEWPGDFWAPFFHQQHPDVIWGQWYKESSLLWMKTALDIVRTAYPDIPFLFSFDNGNVEKYNEIDISFLDAFEHHLWMVHQNNSEFYKLVGYKDGRFSPDAYKQVVNNAERLYNEKPSYWQKLLVDKIKLLSEVARKEKMPLITTECWGIVDYKDWPLLSWEWVKELCELGTLTALNTGMWIAVATSNFCSPQFVGMWRDVKWHRKLTDAIRNTPVNKIFYEHPKALKIIHRL